MGKIRYDELCFDINTIMDFVFNSGEEESRNSEITEIYGVDEASGTLNLLNKQINENKNAKNDSNTAIRYDFMKILISMVCELDEEMTIGEKISLNTLISQGFIKKID